MKITIHSLILFAFTIVSCNSPKSNKETGEAEKSIDNFPYLPYNEENLFPGDGSLLRAEDGVALEDGRIVVVDQAKGLKMMVQIDLLVILKELVLFIIHLKG
jgi:hypothetical protein